MCGIIGLISRSAAGFYKADEDLFSWMLRCNTIRGSDSTGVFGVDSKGLVDTLKGDTDGFTFAGTSNYETFLRKMNRSYRVVIGHNRAATKGAISPHNAHPFQEKAITLVHNGTILNQKDLHKDAEVDSHAIAHGLADFAAVETLEKIEGAFALVWYNADDKTLNIARNSERPLYLSETTGNWIIASEPGLPAWLARRTITKVEMKHMLVPEDNILTFPIEDLSAEPIVTSYKSYTRWAPIESASYHKPFHQRHEQRGGFRLPATPVDSPKLLPAQGDTIIITLDDEAPVSNFPGATTLFLGTMIDVKEGEAIPNIIIRYHLYPSDKEKNIELEKIVLGNKYLKARVQHLTKQHNVFIVQVTDIQPYELIATQRGDLYEPEELKTILKQGCNKCNTGLTIDAAAGTIVARRVDGSHRIVCFSCFDEARNNARGTPQ